MPIVPTGLAARASRRMHAMSNQIAAAASSSSQSKSPGRLVPSETALFVCDVQERFRPIIAGMPAVIDTARRMVKGAKALKLPIIVTEQYPKALGHTVEELKEVLPEETLIQDKVHFSMMVDPVKEHLKGLSVRKSAIDLIEEGYEVHLVVDGVSSQRPSDRAIAIQRIAQMGGLLVSSEMALFQMCGSAKDPAFKTISGLAKEERPEFLPLSSQF